MVLKVERTTTQDWDDVAMRGGEAFSSRRNRWGGEEFASYNGVTDRYIGPKSKELETELRRFWIRNAPLAENERRHSSGNTRYRAEVRHGRLFYRTASGPHWCLNYIPFNLRACELFREWIDASEERLAIEREMFPPPKLYTEEELQERLRQKNEARLSKEEIRNLQGGIVELFNGEIANATATGEPGTLKNIGDVLERFKELLVLEPRAGVKPAPLWERTMRTSLEAKRTSRPIDYHLGWFEGGEYTLHFDWPADSKDAIRWTLRRDGQDHAAGVCSDPQRLSGFVVGLANVVWRECVVAMKDFASLFYEENERGLWVAKKRPMAYTLEGPPRDLAALRRTYNLKGEG